MTQQQNVGYKGHTPQGPTIPQALRNEAHRTDAGFTFLGSGNTPHFYSFAAIEREMNRRGRALLDAGLKKGDRVAFVLPESEDFVLTFLAAIAVGVIPVPLYPPLSFGKLDSYVAATQRIIDKSGATALLTDERVQSVLWSLVDRCPSLTRLLTVESALKSTHDTPVDIDHIDLDDTCFLQFTSGSTAEPKGVVVSHRSLLANLFGIMHTGLKIDNNDVAVSWLPLYHDMGLIGFTLAPAWYGVPTVFIPTLRFIKHPTIWLESIDRYRGTIAFAPNFAYALATRRTRPAKLSNWDLSCLKVLGCGAEPNHPGTLKAFVEHFAPAKLRPEALLPVYGMAEATLAMTFCELEATLHTDSVDGDRYHDDGVAAPASDTSRAQLEYVSCGRAFPGHEICILDERGRAVPERTVGEIVFRGPSVAPGYFEDSERTQVTFTDHGLRTGDLGYLAGGELFVTGRRKDVIILNGRNYDPQSIEWVVAEIEGIRKGNVVALSRPGASTEELVVVAETRADDHAHLDQEVRQRVREVLFLNVADTLFLKPGQLPKTSSGKLQRSKTRQHYLDGVLGREGVRTLGDRGQTLVLARHLARSMLSRVKHNVQQGAPGALLRRIRRNAGGTGA